MKRKPETKPNNTAQRETKPVTKPVTKPFPIWVDSDIPWLILAEEINEIQCYTCLQVKRKQDTGRELGLDPMETGEVLNIN